MSVYGTISDVEADRLNESWADFETCTGIDMVSTSPARSSRRRSPCARRAATPPNLAIFPQPGLLPPRGAAGYLQPAPEAVVANAEEFWSEDWQTTAPSTTPSTARR